MTLSGVVEALRQFYGRLAEPPRDPFAYFVWEVLSAESVPAKRDAAFTALKKIPALTPDAIRRAPPARLEAAIALAGPYREQRLQALRGGVDSFRRTPTLAAVIRGPLPAARRALRAFPHLGEPGARRMLLFAASRRVLPVDARIARVAARLGFGAITQDLTRQARSVQRRLTRELPSDLDRLREMVLYLSHHGSITCAERDPHCGICPLARECAYAQRKIAELRLQNSD
jgi:endonuclease III